MSPAGDPAARRPAEWNREPLPHVRRVLAVASGKGGVGKSSVTVTLAHALRDAGLRAGILDADLYGPSIPRMMGLNKAGQPPLENGYIIPHESQGIRCMSLAFLTGDQAAMLRGLMVTKLLRQLIRGTAWGSESSPLDILLIDMPPGTGDIAISLAQQVPLDGAIIVTTPQPIATADAEKCLELFQRVQVPIVGIVENMSYFRDVSGTALPLFGAGGGAEMAQKSGAKLLGQIPLDPALRAACDEGKNPLEAAGAEAQNVIHAIARSIVNA